MAYFLSYLQMPTNLPKYGSSFQEKARYLIAGFEAARARLAQADAPQSKLVPAWFSQERNILCLLVTFWCGSGVGPFQAAVDQAFQSLYMLWEPHCQAVEKFEQLLEAAQAEAEKKKDWAHLEKYDL